MQRRRSGGRKFERPKERARAIRLFADGMSVPRIARLLDIPWSTADTWVKPPSEDEMAQHREHNASMHRAGHLYLGTVAACPSCGRPGYAELRWQDHIETGVRSFHWAVQHNPHQKINNERKVFDLIAFTEWSGAGIVFTSPKREQEFQELVGVA